MTFQILMPISYLCTHETKQDFENGWSYPYSVEFHTTKCEGALSVFSLQLLQSFTPTPL